MPDTHGRMQRTIGSDCSVGGIGFLTGADVTLRFLPAASGHGIVFQRVDLSGQPLVAATFDNLVPRDRRTGISKDGTTIELVEHVMAALAGLQIDNCVVQIDAPEAPGFDGSSQPIVDCLQDAGFEEQNQPKQQLVIEHDVIMTAGDGSSIHAMPATGPGLSITCEVDYGATSPIPMQSATYDITPETFAAEIAFARTFVLETEVAALKAQGYGKRTTEKDLLVFGPDGVIDNSVRADNECARHKLLDCVGDFALSGCDIVGRFVATRTGHRMNHDIMQHLMQVLSEPAIEDLAA